MTVARAALLCAALLLSACSSAPSLSPLAPEAVIVAFGDSLTFGTGASETESYPAQLERLIGRRVIDAGVPGEVSAAGLERLPAVLDEHRPQLLLLCEGGNDFLRQLGKRQAAEHLRAMVRLARSRGVDVLLIGTPQPGLTITPPGFYADIAAEFRIPYEGEVIGRVLRDETLKSDPIHPNAAGYGQIAASVAALLGKAGAVGR